jgi:ring-1,2-phenylacetyl-CoA epoxidase subunit PaaD
MIGKPEVSFLQTEREQKVWELLESVADPEIPVLSLVELGIVRSVKVGEESVEVEITPTFMGCPALERMKHDIRQRLQEANYQNVNVVVNFASPWSTELLNEKTREKLRNFGIAPPPHTQKSLSAVLQLPVACPFCTSTDTQLENPFGSTLCKQIYYCNSCRQSFERFKPL